MIEVTRSGRVAAIALHRPEKRNALNAELCRALVQAIDEADADAEVGSILLRGHGAAFCAGASNRPQSESERERDRERS